MSSARKIILAKIQDALPASALPDQARTTSPLETSAAGSLGEQVVQISERCERQRNELIQRFESELTKVGGRFYFAESLEAARQYILQLAASRNARSVVGWDADVVHQLEVDGELAEAGIEFVADTDLPDGEFVQRATHAELGISGVDFALADTGTLVLLAGKGRARTASLLPPLHIAVMQREQLISGLDDLFPLLRFTTTDADLPMASAVTFITGPSRTGDIEMILVVGVHGPQQLHVILLNDLLKREAEESAQE